MAAITATEHPPLRRRPKYTSAPPRKCSPPSRARTPTAPQHETLARLPCVAANQVMDLILIAMMTASAASSATEGLNGLAADVRFCLTRDPVGRRPVPRPTLIRQSQVRQKQAFETRILADLPLELHRHRLGVRTKRSARVDHRRTLYLQNVLTHHNCEPGGGTDATT